jgi:hypothetical protein
MVIEAAHRLGSDESTFDERVLAVEIRSRKFGFAVLQGTDLLDWGVRGFPAGAQGLEAAIGRLVFLLRLYAPSTVTARRTRRVRDESSKRASRVLRRIRTELKRRSVPFIVIARHDVRKFFAGHGCRTKQQVAAVIADSFGQLKLRLPRLRKPWEPERNIVVVFDALATAVAFNVLREPTADT